MTEVKVHKADAIGPSMTVQDAVISVTEALPTADYANVSLQQWALLYDVDAGKIEEALYYSLPGGTYAALLVAMLQRRACHFRVPFEAWEKRAKEEEGQ